MNTPILIKLGGSLIHHGKGEILHRLGSIIDQLSADHPLLIISGGGPFADTVRRYSEKFALREETCHFMALSAMDQYAFLLQEFIPGSILTNLLNINSWSDLPSAAGPQILVCSGFLGQISSDELPRTWDVTSDSIAAYLAKQWRAASLVVLKSTDIDPRLQEPDVDAFFHHLLPLNMPVWFVNGLYPERLARLLKTGSTKGVYLPVNCLSGSIVL
ncbi:MAG: hypothetical protein AAGU27_08380 [Dehalobacterium sp.]